MKKISMLLIISILISCFSGLTITFAKSDKINIKYGEVNEWEAEEYANIVNNAAYIIGEHADASNGKVVEVTNTIDFVSEWPAKTPSELNYTINVEEEGIYFFWIRARAPDTGSDSTYIFFDDAGQSLSDFDKWGEFAWYIVSTEHLTKGTHVINFLHRERHLQFDKFALTTIPDYVPGGVAFSTPEYLPEFGEEAELYYPLPSITPPKNEHPRIFLRSKDIPNIKANLTHEQNIESYKAVIENANLECDGIFPPMESTQSTNVTGNDLMCAESAAFLYLINGDIEMGKKAVNIAVNAMRTMTNRKGGDTATRIGGNAILNCAMVYDWCYDIMTDEQRAEIRRYLYLHISITEIGWPAILLREVNTHAQEGLVWLDLLTAGIAIYDEDPKLYNLVAGRVLSQALPIKNQMYNSVFTTEGSNYGPFRLIYELYAAYIFKAMGYENVFNPNQQYQRYGDFWLRRPDGRYIKSGDDAQEDNYGFTTAYLQGLFLSANYYKDPYLKREFFRSSKFGINKGTGPSIITAPMHLIFNDVNVLPDKTFRDFANTVYGGTPSGQMVARTGWDEGLNSDSLIANMYIGERFYGGHQHLNSGHFDIFYKGALAIDSGIYESAPFIKNGVVLSSATLLNYGSEHDFNYSKRTIAHNCMLIFDPNEVSFNSYTKNNDGGQRGGYGTGFVDDYDDVISEKTNTGKVLAYDYGPDTLKPAYSYLKGDITKAYSKKINHYSRSFMFLNFFDKEYPGALIVLDNVESADPSFKKTWLLHSQEEPEVDGNTTTIKRTEFGNNGRLINKTLLPSQFEITKIGGAGHEFEVNGVNWTAVPKSKIQEAGKWRIELSPEDANKKDYFLNVMQISENNDEIKPLKVTTLENTDKYVGIEIKDRVVYLRKDDLISSKDLTFKSEAENETIMYIADGMKEGKWNIYDKNGKLIFETLSYKGHNTISFSAPKGEYTAKWTYEKTGEKSFISKKENTDSNPLDIKLNFVYETFKNNPHLEDGEVYVDIFELVNKIEGEHKITQDAISFENNINIDLADKTYTKEGKANALKTYKKENGISYIAISEFADILSFNYDYDKIANIAYLSSPESNIDKFMLENSDDPDRVRIAKITATPFTTESPYNSVDANQASYWAAPGKDMWIQYQFEEPAKLTEVELFWLVGHTRKETFKMEASYDGINYDLLFNGTSDGKTAGFEKIKVSSDKEYKYLKITGYENTTNYWNSLCEIRIYKEI